VIRYYVLKITLNLGKKSHTSVHHRHKQQKKREQEVKNNSALMNNIVQDRLREKVRKLALMPGNNVCMDCSKKNPTFVCLQYRIFICDICSDVHRKYGHNGVKTISFSTFTKEEVELLAAGGNAEAEKKLYSGNTMRPEQVKPQENKYKSLADYKNACDKHIENVYVKRMYMGSGTRVAQKSEEEIQNTLRGISLGGTAKSNQTQNMPAVRARSHADDLQHYSVTQSTNIITDRNISAVNQNVYQMNQPTNSGDNYQSRANELFDYEDQQQQQQYQQQQYQQPLQPQRTQQQQQPQYQQQQYQQPQQYQNLSVNPSSYASPYTSPMQSPYVSPQVSPQPQQNYQQQFPPQQQYQQYPPQQQYAQQQQYQQQQQYVPQQQYQQQQYSSQPNLGVPTQKSPYVSPQVSPRASYQQQQPQPVYTQQQQYQQPQYQAESNPFDLEFSPSNNYQAPVADNFSQITNSFQLMNINANQQRTTPPVSTFNQQSSYSQQQQPVRTSPPLQQQQQPVMQRQSSQSSLGVPTQKSPYTSPQVSPRAQPQQQQQQPPTFSQPQIVSTGPSSSGPPPPPPLPTSTDLKKAAKSVPTEQPTQKPPVQKPPVQNTGLNFNASMLANARHGLNKTSPRGTTDQLTVSPRAATDQTKLSPRYNVTPKASPRGSTETIGGDLAIKKVETISDAEFDAVHQQKKNVLDLDTFKAVTAQDNSKFRKVNANNLAPMKQTTDWE
jgi:hypothetical protein